MGAAFVLRVQDDFLSTCLDEYRQGVEVGLDDEYKQFEQILDQALLASDPGCGRNRTETSYILAVLLSGQVCKRGYRLAVVH